ncbi:hypothetical protein T492DRAFT_598883 [Pavlovales sp. CCMP2436]|nr:hypothetical protein T492DRAFT_598883 [Pavlovales sp. CCMP2436]
MCSTALSGRARAERDTVRPPVAPGPDNAQWRAVPRPRACVWGRGCLASALGVNTTLVEWLLDGNYIGAVSAWHIAEVLAANATVTWLDLFGNKIGDVGAQHIAEAFKVNTTVTRLDLCSNVLTEEGACALVAVADSRPIPIKSFCGIRADREEVNFSGRGLDAADVVLFAFELCANATMTKLDLGFNEVGDNGTHLAEALKLKAYNFVRQQHRRGRRAAHHGGHPGQRNDHRA